MKSPTLVLTVAVTAFALGCQDGVIQEGFPDSPSSEIKLSRILPVDHVVPLIATLANPGNGTPAIEVDGELVVSTNEISPDCPWTSFSVGIQAYAELKPAKDKGPIWTIHGTTLDQTQFEVSATGEKSYILQGRKDGMTLHIRLTISREDITLDAMWLELPHKNPSKEF